MGLFGGLQSAKARERKRKRKPKELEGLIPLEEELLTFKEAVIKNANDRIHDFLYRRYGIIWNKMGRGAFLLSKYTDARGELVDVVRKLRLEEEDQLNWLEMWYALGESMRMEEEGGSGGSIPVGRSLKSTCESMPPPQTGTTTTGWSMW